MVEIAACPKPYAHYTVSPAGEVFLDGERIHGHLLKSGYINVNLKDDKGERHVHAVHRFVYWCFNPVYDQTMDIDHINSHRTDNRIDNLQALTKHEHIRKTVRDMKPVSREARAMRNDGYNRYKELDDEAWYVPTEIIATFLGFSLGAVSDMGRFKCSVNGTCMTRGALDEKGIYIHKGMTVSRIICAVFHGPPPSPTSQAIHLNGDSKDNRAVNVAWSESARRCVPYTGWATHACKSTADILSSRWAFDALFRMVFDLKDEEQLQQGVKLLRHEDDLLNAWKKFTNCDTISPDAVAKIKTGYKLFKKVCSEIVRPVSGGSYTYIARRGGSNTLQKSYRVLTFSGTYTPSPVSKAA